MVKELNYPFDCDYIIKKKKKIKKELLAQNDQKFIKKRIAVLGGSTTNDIIAVMELFLLNNGIMPEFYESEYNRYYEEAVFPNEQLKSFEPDIIYVCTSYRNLRNLPCITDSEQEVSDKLLAEYNRLENIWKMLNDHYHCIIIQNNFELPSFRMMGNREASDFHGTVNFVGRLNQMMYTYAQKKENLHICDINYISATYGLDQWADPFYWYMYKYAMAVPAIPYLSFNVANIIKSILGKNKKGFVLDLDNTLWGGIVGDDGVEALEIGPEEAEGQAYLEFQEYIKKYESYGIVLNVNSKNEYENAIAGLNHECGILRPEDFICIRANWLRKSENIKSISEELNILPESLVFVDDNPAERMEVEKEFPAIRAPEIDNVTNYIRMIDHSGFFEMTSYSADDVQRMQMYKDNQKRHEMQISCDNYEEYLCSLQMQAEIKAFEPLHVARIAQLTNKSNQFNLTTKRYTVEDIEQVMCDKGTIGIYGRLRDCFGDNGIVSVVIAAIREKECHIDLWLMSCRVLKRDMEFAMMDALVQRCRDREVKQIYGYYYPTKKNGMVKEFYGLMGFEKIDETEERTLWKYDIPSAYEKKNKFITVED